MMERNEKGQRGKETYDVALVVREDAFHLHDLSGILTLYTAHFFLFFINVGRVGIRIKDKNEFCIIILTPFLENLCRYISR